MGKVFKMNSEDTKHIVQNGNLKERIYIKNGKSVTMINLNGKWVEKPGSNDSNT
jgi:hypothetical protein